MRRLPRVACVIALACAASAAPAAFAKGPSTEQLPTLEDVLVRATKAKEEQERAALEASRDPRREAIEDYKSGKTPLAEFKALTDIISDSKDDDLRDYRRPAATAIMLRFRAEPLDDPNVRKLRADAVLEILDLMRAPSKDRLGLSIIQSVLDAFWKNKVREYGFSATGKPRDRYSAYKAMKKYLQSGEGN